MKTIRQKISLPFIWVAVILPMAVLLVFSVFLRLYMVQTAGSDLKMTAAVMKAQVRQQLADSDPAALNTPTQKILSGLESLRSVIQASRMTSDTDLVLVSRDDRILFPNSTTADGLNKRVLERLKLQLIRGFEADRVKSIQTINGQYLYIGFPVQSKNPDQSPVLIFVTRLSLTRGILFYTNLILLAILFVGASISIFLALRTAKRISDPLLRLRGFADRIGSGSFTAETPDQSIQEVADLYGQMNKMVQRLAQADNAQKTFLQNASHELRTPLMVIQGYAEGMQSGVLTDSKKAAGIICEESRRLTRLVESLLTLTRIENRSGQPNLLRLNLPDLLSDHVQRIQDIAEKEGKAVLFQPGSAPMEVMADEDLLAQAVTNILTNAVRYARETILVRIHTDTGSACISIQDDGPGIAYEDLPHLFDRFYKGNKGQFGLGLAIAHSAVTAMNGVLTVENASPGGAVFRICLPLVQSVP